MKKEHIGCVQIATRVIDTPAFSPRAKPPIIKSKSQLQTRQRDNKAAEETQNERAYIGSVIPSGKDSQATQLQPE